MRKRKGCRYPTVWVDIPGRLMVRTLSQADVPAEISPTKNSDQTQKQSSRTGDEASVLMWLLCGISALGMIAFKKRKRRLS